LDKTTIIIVALIIGFSVLSSVIKRIKKANTPQQNYKKPVQNQQQTTYNKPPQTQPKSLEDILKTLLNEQKPVTKPTQDTYKTPVNNDKPLVKSTPLEDGGTLETIEEEKYYGYDTELTYDKEEEDYDKMTDHRVHGAGFDLVEEKLEEEEDEWANIDWRKAVITAEILRRPQY
jgi:hypothetical protein